MSERPKVAFLPSHIRSMYSLRDGKAISMECRPCTSLGPEWLGIFSSCSVFKVLTFIGRSIWCVGTFSSKTRSRQMVPQKRIITIFSKTAIMILNTF
jgi:hypothetical protein